MSSVILFLDVHGPLQPARVHFGETVIHEDDDQYDRFDPLAVDCVKKLVTRTGAKIVMNSTTTRSGERYVARMFEVNGYPEWPEHIHRHWCTPFDAGLPRDLAIKVWLREAERRGEKISHYAILDDADVNDSEHQVLVDFDNGITVADYQRAIKLLGGHDSFIIY